MPLLEQVLKTYPGKVKLVHKNFPLGSHRFARQAAAAALAAERQGKFWEFHDRLFEQMTSLGGQKFGEIAQALGLDQTRFEQDMRDPQIQGRINQDITEASGAAVRGTPTIFVNGRLLKNRSMEGFKAVIERELERSGKGGQ